MAQRLGRLLALTTAALLLTAGTASASLSMTISGGLQKAAGQVTDDAYQAGDHPNLSLTIKATGDEKIQDMDLTLPPGLVGDPNAVTLCTMAQHKSPAGCPKESQVGETKIRAIATLTRNNLLAVAPLLFIFNPPDPVLELPITANGKVFALEPQGKDDQREPALLGIRIVPVLNLCDVLVDIPADLCAALFPPQDLEDAVQTLEAEIQVDSPGKFSLTTALREIPTEAHLGDLTLEQQITEMVFTLYGTPPHGNGKPFMTAPTSCGEKQVTLSAVSYEGTAIKAQTPAFTIKGCEKLPFNPTLSVTPNTMEAGMPVAQNVVSGITFPAPDNELAQAHLKKAVFTMPVGFGVSAGMAADGLEGCTDGQFEITKSSRHSCPALSNIGDVVFDSPLVGPVEGNLFLATPTPDVPLRLFIYAEAGKVKIKVLGKTLLDPKTGQVTLLFDDTFETPYTKFGLTFRGGPTGMLKAADTCGDYTVSGAVTPFSGNPAAPVESNQLTVDGCKARTFAPKFSASATSTTAAGITDLTTTISRTDDDELLGAMRISMPAGLLANLPGVTQCALAKARVGDCGLESQIGWVYAEAGTGSKPLVVPQPGKVYLTEGFDGTIAGLAIVLAAKVGPIDLGNAVVMGKFDVRPDLGIDIVADEVPTILGGIPLYLRSMKLDLNKPGFTFNASSCKAQQWKATFRGSGGATSTASDGYQATGCENVPFEPTMTAKVTGTPQSPGFETTVINRGGDSTLEGTVLTLPLEVGVDENALNRGCQKADFDADRCAAQSTIGEASASSPLIPLPLTGKVVLVQVPGQNLPWLGLKLRGQLSFDLLIENTVNGGRIVSKIAGLPDAPISRFDLKFAPGGLLKSELVALCEKPLAANGVFTAHSEASRQAAVPVDVSAMGCPANGQASVSASLRSVRKGRKPVLTITATAGLRKLTSMKVTVPSRQLALRRAARKGIRGTSSDGKTSPTVKAGSVRLSAPTVGGARRMTIRMSTGAVVAKRLKAGQRVTLKVRITQAGSTKARTITLRVRAQR